MTEKLVRGVPIHYEIFGATGPWLAFTPGSRRSFAELAPLAKRLADHNYRVLLHDRRNCGASGVRIEDKGSEHEIWADDLAELFSQLDVGPVFIGGASAGARLALLFALRHPELVRGLMLWRVTGGRHAAEKLSEQYYGSFIKVAQSGGMASVCDTDHFRGCIESRLANRQALMEMKVSDFVDVMEKWRVRFLQDAELPIVGATEEQLRGIRIPTCVIAGNDKVHTPATARRLRELIANCEFHDDVVQRRADSDLLNTWDQKEWQEKEGKLGEIILSFLESAATPQSRVEK